MITTPAYAGAAFGTSADGDLADPAIRAGVAGELGISDDWAWMSQVHGTNVVLVTEPGTTEASDGLVTGLAGLPLAVRTADCVPVVLHAPRAVGVVHAGWRGLAAGVVAAAIDVMRRTGQDPERAAIGPSIGPCCYEVGDEVIAAFDGRAVQTRQGTPSVDLWSEAAAQLEGLEVWRADLCTYCETGFHSFRATGTAARQTSVGWL
ncbi:MAG: polyphenol oxidase family protein [Acidimicrobiia bacterium]|nr:polyphenol oxidase family protein [Acidimicrobiia bacterium]NNF11215.1 polyphenol oxidase family protein [Acidimicrobiia bacterium]